MAGEIFCVVHNTAFTLSLSSCIDDLVSRIASLYIQNTPHRQKPDWRHDKFVKLVKFTSTLCLFHARKSKHSIQNAHRQKISLYWRRNKKQVAANTNSTCVWSFRTGIASHAIFGMIQDESMNLLQCKAIHAFVRWYVPFHFGASNWLPWCVSSRASSRPFGGELLRMFWGRTWSGKIWATA